MSLKENAWTREVSSRKEDDLLYEYVLEKKFRKWTKIANILNEMFSEQAKTGKQCRERWHNHLDPGISKDLWTKEEKKQIFELQIKYGNRWSKISKCIPGRTDNSIKNCFYSVLRKNLRKYNKRKPENEKLKGSIKVLLQKPDIKAILFNQTIQNPGNNSKSFPEKKSLKPIEIVCPEVAVSSFQSISTPITPSNCASIYCPQYTQYFSFSENLEYQDSPIYQCNPFVSINFPFYVQNFYNDYQPFAKYSENRYFFCPEDIV